jgi:hypothetical protein
MAAMIRKQVYLRPRQDLQIKQLAEERGTTEADIIRQAVDLLLAESQRLRRAQNAWEAAQALMETRASYAVQDNQIEEHAWTRDELYTERLERHEQDPD